MDYVDAVDLGDAPEIFISGISKVEQIGPGTIRFTFYSERDNCRRVVLHTVWDLKRWHSECSHQIEGIRLELRSTAGDLHPRAS